jgi:flagellar protein FlaJ
MRKISMKTRKLTVAVSIVAVLVFLVLVSVFNHGVFVNYSNELFLVCVLVVIFPSAILDYEHQKWIQAIEDQMPLLVRGVSESQETGLTITKALEKVVQNKMLSGPLSDEVHKLSVQMAWGTSFEDALVNFRDRIRSPIVSRFCALVLEASRAGGTIKKVFTATSDFMEEMNEMDKETSAQMRPYIIVIYAAFGVFIVTAAILVQSFFAPLQGSPMLMSEASVGSVDVFTDFFYKNMLVSAVTGGLMAGKLGERRVAGGLKHAIILSLVGYAVFMVLIPPKWFVSV